MGSLEDCAAEAVVCFIYGDGVEWDGNSTPVQGFTELLPFGFAEVQAHLPWAVYDWELFVNVYKQGPVLTVW